MKEEIRKSNFTGLGCRKVTKRTYLGTGTFGENFKGYCDGTKVAIKRPFVREIPPELWSTWENEISAIGAIRHPHLVMVLGTCAMSGDSGSVEIITEFMDDNIQNLLITRNNYKKISLLKRLNMAKQAALAMAYLHSTNPPILHGDLKPANLMVKYMYTYSGIDYVVKVSDYYGTYLFKKGQKDKWYASLPVRTAPEVLQRHQFCKEADVYAFGICLWQMYACREPYPQYLDSTPTEFREAICVRKERPPVPDDCEHELKSLFKQCWHYKPQKRPDFLNIVTHLELIILNVSITEPAARVFWTLNFSYRTPVGFQEFIDKFNSSMGQDIKDQSDEYNCLQALLVRHEANEVSMSSFGFILSCFGPICPGTRKLVDRIMHLLSHPWFHGFLTPSEAGVLLYNAKPFSFLVRFIHSGKHTSKDKFILTFVDHNATIHKLQISQNETATQFQIGEKAFPSIVDFITYYRSHPLKFSDTEPEVQLGAPIGESQYLQCFEKHKKKTIVYEDVEKLPISRSPSRSPSRTSPLTDTPLFPSFIGAKTPNTNTNTNPNPNTANTALVFEKMSINFSPAKPGLKDSFGTDTTASVDNCCADDTDSANDLGSINSSYYYVDDDNDDDIVEKNLANQNQNNKNKPTDNTTNQQSNATADQNNNQNQNGNNEEEFEITYQLKLSEDPPSPLGKLKNYKFHPQQQEKLNSPTS